MFTKTEYTLSAREQSETSCWDKILSGFFFLPWQQKTKCVNTVKLNIWLKHKTKKTETSFEAHQLSASPSLNSRWEESTLTISACVRHNLGGRFTHDMNHIERAVDSMGDGDSSLGGFGLHLFWPTQFMALWSCDAHGQHLLSPLSVHSRDNKSGLKVKGDGRLTRHSVTSRQRPDSQIYTWWIYIDSIELKFATMNNNMWVPYCSAGKTFNTLPSSNNTVFMLLWATTDPHELLLSICYPLVVVFCHDTWKKNAGKCT